MGAFGEDSGMRATEIKPLAYLKRGVRVREKEGCLSVILIGMIYQMVGC